MLDQQTPEPGMLLRIAARDRDFGFEITAAWRDVQAKARRIRAEGGVRIVIASHDGIGGQVKGDHDVYETLLVYAPGTRKVASWQCGCKWFSFAWDRSPAFKRFQGRKCAHALALQFEAQSQGMFGKEIHRQERPGWLTKTTPVVTEYDKDTGRNILVRPYQGALIHPLVAALRVEDADPADVIGNLMRAGMRHQTALRLWKLAYPREEVGPLLPVKHAGYKGYVDEYEGHHDEMEKMDRRLDGHPDGAHGFDEDLWDDSAPEPHSHEQAHYEEHGDYPDSYHERHEDAYAKAHQQREEAVRPVGHHTALINFISTRGDDHDFWNEHARLEDVDHGRQGVYATQPYVTKKHLDRYTQNRDDQVAHVRQFGDSETSQLYPGTHHPMMVRHEGNLFTIEGHHRTASDILSGRKTKALVYDADKHGFPLDEEDSYDVEHHGLVKHAAKRADCDYRISDPKAAREHALRHHDDGVCTATERHRAHKGRHEIAEHRESHDTEHRCPHCGGFVGVEAIEHNHCPHCGAPLGTERHGAAKRQEAPTVSGIALKAHDTGRVLMIQRDHSDEKDPARGRWEFPAGHHEDGDLTSLHAGVREFQEEVGQPFPENGIVQHTWTSPSGVYQGHVVVIPSEADLSMQDGRVVPNPDDPKGDHHEQAAWWEIEHARKNPALREELKQGTPWKEIEKASLGKEAAAWDPISNVNPQPGRGISEPLHSNSTNPVSTGFATSEDPPDWDNLNTDPGRMTPTLGYDAVLHHHVEPALPSTDGDKDRAAPLPFGTPAPRVDADTMRHGYDDLTEFNEDHPEVRIAEISRQELDPVPDNPPKPDDLVSEQDSDIGLLDGSAMPNMVHASLPESARVAAVVQQFQQTDAARALMAETDQDTQDIAAAARAHLQKTALAEFSAAEQQELINENPGGRARNFTELDLDGTHYALLQAALDAEGDDATLLFL